MPVDVTERFWIGKYSKAYHCVPQRDLHCARTESFQDGKFSKAFHTNSSSRD